MLSEPESHPRNKNGKQLDLLQSLANNTKNRVRRTTLEQSVIKLLGVKLVFCSGSARLFGPHGEYKMLKQLRSCSDDQLSKLHLK